MGKLVIATHKELTEMVTSLRAENEKLRAALKPFAVMAMLDSMKEYEASPDECVMTAGSWGNKPLLTFCLGDLRAARAALKEAGDE